MEKVTNLTFRLKKMKKRLSSCLECGDDTSILTQVSGSPESVLLCTDCYHLKYSHEGQNEIDYTEEEKVKKNVFEGTNHLNQAI